MHLFKQLLIILVSFFLTIVAFYLCVVGPAVFLLQQGNENPPPPFDVGPNGIYFTHPMYQVPVTIALLLVPIFGSFIAYLLNGSRRNLTVLLPAIVGFLIYGGWVVFFYYRLTTLR